VHFPAAAIVKLVTVSKSIHQAGMGYSKLGDGAVALGGPKRGMWYAALTLLVGMRFGGNSLGEL
jgi:hypothetical protein